MLKQLNTLNILNFFQSTLQERMLPNAENVSYSALLSMDLSRFFIKIFPTPDLRSDGSRWDHMILIGFPLIKSKFIVSSARSAATERVVTKYKCKQL